MKNLIDILSVIGNHEAIGEVDRSITGLAIDSRKVEKGMVYIAQKGTQVDGHDYIRSAISQGAVVIVCEDIPAELNPDVTYIKVLDTKPLSGKMASAFYDFPSSDFTLVGVTGTNGKTTCTTLLFDLFTQMGSKCGLISTVNYRIGNIIYDSTHTTPDPISLQKLMYEFRENDCQYVFMEVSSHAVDQDRIAGLEFDGAVFTNMSRDHLDYHETFDEYIAAKKKFFDGLSADAFALTNKDDKRGSVMLQNTAASKHSYSVNGTGEFNAKLIEDTFEGLHLLIDGEDVYTRLIGEFNAYNFMAVFGVASLLGKPKDEFLPFLSALMPAEGRFEYVISPIKNIVAIVDYAHTPDALLNVLNTIQDIKRKESQNITVVGCGGDRDKGKRPEMAEVSAEHSDRCIFTSDNPRGEEPMAIIDDMILGVPASLKSKVFVQVDRREAIRMAMTMAGNGDVVLVAGKGHEKYQEIKGIKNKFDDKEVILETIKEQNL